MNVRDCIFFQLTKASQTGAEFWTKKVKHLNVTASQAMVLNFLGEEDRLLANSLRQKLQITSATMTGILDRLEKLELIERQPHPDDRRAILVCLTDRGRQCATEINSIMVQANEEFLSGFNPEESGCLHQMLERIRSNEYMERLSER
ncbi:MarR family transcriptional regulator [Desulfosarcina widdelii]|uniref:MarR family transcriptional regulator n=1 Tax=Desulfosarcina widdelii TaxID=947919 RepID=A0A5K7Z9L2_9BACT|nr:MarR family transcriptional regulator [Desulfosarcina widdelii]BBO73167.1 MarR family transcriptional regulator [Desulfosarcina widdelii]